MAGKVDPRLAEQAARPRDGAGGADDRVVDHGRGDRGAAHGIDLVDAATGARDRDRRAHVQPAVLIDERLQVTVLNADHQDGFVLLEDRNAGDAAVEIEPDQHVERLAGIADRGHHLAGAKHVAEQFVAAVSRRGRRRAFHGADAGRRGHDRAHALGILSAR